MDTLVGFKPLYQYGEGLIKPARHVNETLIVREWPTIQRILASLAQKDVTQATVVRKLASYVRQNQTRKALWELEHLCRTLYLLDFVDDVTLRQSVQQALNRGEAYHRFRRAVAFVNGGKFRVKTEAEQQIWNECSRLITNAIIYYNTALLSKVYEQNALPATNRRSTFSAAFRRWPGNTSICSGPSNSVPACPQWISTPWPRATAILSTGAGARCYRKSLTNPWADFTFVGLGKTAMLWHTSNTLFTSATFTSNSGGG
jgi:hypothetical protein